MNDLLKGFQMHFIHSLYTFTTAIDIIVDINENYLSVLGKNRLFLCMLVH